MQYFEDTDIDCSMCSTILPSGDSSGTTLEVPSEALLHLEITIAVSCNWQLFRSKTINMRANLHFLSKLFAHLINL